LVPRSGKRRSRGDEGQDDLVAFLIPSCGGRRTPPDADREEKRETHGTSNPPIGKRQKQLDFKDPNQRSLLEGDWLWDELGLIGRRCLPDNFGRLSLPRQGPDSKEDETFTDDRDRHFMTQGGNQIGSSRLEWLQKGPHTARLFRPHSIDHLFDERD